MRKRYRILSLAALVVALAVPFGFALSLESTQLRTTTSSHGPGVTAATPLAIGGHRPRGKDG